MVLLAAALLAAAGCARKQTTWVEVVFRFRSPDPGATICVLGDFNYWGGRIEGEVQMPGCRMESTDAEGGRVLRYYLTPGRYEFLFYDGEQWLRDPGLEAVGERSAHRLVVREDGYGFLRRGARAPSLVAVTPVHVRAGEPLPFPTPWGERSRLDGRQLRRLALEGLLGLVAALALGLLLDRLRLGRLGPRGRLLLALAVGLLAFGLRLRAVGELPPHGDEPQYLFAAERYADSIRLRYPQLLWEFRGDREHPALGKIMFGAALYLSHSWEETPSHPRRSLVAARTVTIIAGALIAAALAWIQPLAGLLFAGFHGLGARYSMLAYTDALAYSPLIFALILLEATTRRRTLLEPRPDRRLLGAAALTGCAMAIKYHVIPFFPAAALLGLEELRHRRRSGPTASLRGPLLALGIFLVAFYVTDPILWPDPVGELYRSWQAIQAKNLSAPWLPAMNWPWYQQAIHLVQHTLDSRPLILYPLEGVIFVLAIPGLPFLFRRHRAFFWFHILAAVMLAVFPTRTAQYALILVPTLCLSAALFTIHAGPALLQRLRRGETIPLARSRAEPPGGALARADHAKRDQGLPLRGFAGR
jgi:hypothetical protein